jgi:DNA end-binding protein Ku
MFYADEVRDFSALDLDDTPVRDKELSLAEMLITELTEERFDPMQYKDEYRERLLDRIRNKSEGEVIVSEAPGQAEAGEVIDIMEALRRSLEGGTGRKRAEPQPQASRAAAKKAPPRTADRPKAAKKKAS